MVNDGFSFGRMLGYLGYCMPRYRKQILLYGCVSLVTAILTLCPFTEELQMGVYTLFFGAMNVMYMIAPVIYAKGADTRNVDRMLPFRASERFWGDMGYMFVILPFTLYLLPMTARFIYMHAETLQTERMMYMLHLSYGYPLLTLTNVLTGAGAAMTCYYFVMRCRTGRMAYGLVSVLVYNVVIGMIGMVWGMSVAFMEGFHAGYNDLPSDYNEKQVIDSILDQMGFANGASLTMSMLLFVYLVLMGCLSYRTLRKGNL